MRPKITYPETFTNASIVCCCFHKGWL